MHIIKNFILTSLLCFTLVACQPSKKPDLVIGTISGPETELVKTAIEVAKDKYGLDIKIVEFSDYNLPNDALADGSLDMNIYQHLPFLKSSLTAKGYHLDVFSKTFIYPMGIYSHKIKHINQLKSKATIALPNDPSNQTRALILLQQSGLIICADKETIGLHDILSNPKDLKFKELDAAQLPRVLPDVDAAVINTTFAIPAGLNPTKDALFIEGKDSPYANLMVIRHDTDKLDKLTQFLDAMHSKPVIKRAKELFGDGAIPAWTP
jgi:D-methionine transport system substrate-binding protein